MTKRQPPPPPPPKKRRLPVTTGGRATEIDLSGVTTVQEAVYHALMIYIATPGLSIRELWQTRRIGNDDESPFIRDHVAYSTLEAASKKGKWYTRREEHWGQVEARVINRLQDAAVQKQINELLQVEAVEGILLNHIHGVTDPLTKKVVIYAAKPKSLEGAVGALVNLAKYKDAKRSRVQADLAAGARPDRPGGTVSSVPDVEDNLTEEDIVALAAYLASLDP